MAATASLVLQGVINATPSGSRTIGPLLASSLAANGQVQRISLANGANTITLPTVPAPSGCLIVLPGTNVAETTLKGVAGDTGIDIGLTGWHLLQFNTASLPTSFVLSSAGAQTGLITEIIFF